MSKESPYLPCKVLCRHFRIAKGTCLRIVLWYVRHEKVPSLLGSPCSEHESEGRKRHLITWSSFDIRERSSWLPKV
jgi:hypothetical protein